MAALIKSPVTRAAAVRAPGPGFLDSLRWLPRFRRDPLRAVDTWARRYGDVARIGSGPRVFYLLSHPRHVEHVLVRNAGRYSKQMIGYKKLGAVLGRGLLTSEGEPWRARRRVVQPAFVRDRIASAAPQIAGLTDAMLRHWSHGSQVDVVAEMMSLTFRIVGQAILGADLAGIDEREVAADVGTILEHVADTMMRLVDWPGWLPTPGNLRFRAAVRRFDRQVYAGLHARIADPTPHDDLLAMLLAAPLRHSDVRDEVVTMMGAGHETTAAALCWTWDLVARHEDVEARMHAEVDRVLGGRLPTADDVPRLVYTTAVIKESMRLFPPVWIVARRAMEDDEIDGYAVPKGSVVLLSAWVTHRHRDVWERPDAFEPDRFLPGAPAVPRFAWFPFGAGPRACIGSGFALLEATVIAATVASRFRLQASGSNRPAMVPSVTLRPGGPMPMVAQRRAPPPPC